MFKIFKPCILKQIWEIKNNKFRLFLGIFANVIILLTLYYSIITQKKLNILGIDYPSFILIYAVLWLILSSFSQVSNVIVNESKIGTIEQLIISPFGIIRILLVNILIKAVISISFITIVLIISNSITQNIEIFNIMTFIVTLLIGIFSLYGIGIIIASISLLSKEATFIITIIKFGVLYVILKFENNLLIPFSYAKTILTELIINNKPISEYSIQFMLLFITNSAIYFLIGIVCFVFIEKIALKRGKLIGN